MATLVELAKVMAELAWPLAFVVFVWRFYQPVKQILEALRQQIIRGATVKYGEVELNGVSISDFPLADSSFYTVSAADEEIFKKRHENYSSSKNIFLVHRVKLTGEVHGSVSLPIYDVSVYLVGHKHYGALNEVKSVEYYFGEYFREDGNHQFGSKYVVRNSRNGFAVRTTAYGPTLCEARVQYHDGSEALLSRYVDFEGTGYKYDAEMVSKADGANR
ncbi:pYEATS domain-containing protein [Ciceribacter sp. RN22]|uniref:pYEATS domain-containing protein n=1 Tax=Ciceribacter sp. RN22 TaxID=2954932 RepID=UPI0020930FC2|nr:pYEATS domain-containing protein [Ciceribacter sp. RN22]MCO6178237.1 hypothetical protein [Ciceribacter sp. RN22]